ncbi:MAG: hypothetical protein AAF432_00455 [Planctomycetota bacterium]
MPSTPAVITVPFEEKHGSPTESWRTEGASSFTFGSGTFSARRALICDWAQRNLLAQQLTGSFATSGNLIIVKQPARYPDFALAFVTSVDVRGFGKSSDGGNDQIAYPQAELSVTYEIPQFQFSSDLGDQVLVEESLDAFGEYLTLPHRKLFWDASQNDPLNIDEAPGKLVQGANWNFSILQVPALPAGLFALTGKVNQADVISQTLGLTFAAGTLLCGNINPSRVITTDGAGAWKLPISLQYKPDGWNKFYRGGDLTTPQSIYDSSGTELVAANGVYVQADFTTIPGLTAA